MRRAFPDVLVLAVAGIAACGGDRRSGGEAVDGYLLGEPDEGIFWSTIDGELELAPFAGQTDNGVWIASGEADALTQPQLDALKAVYQAGFPIVLVLPTGDDIQKLADGIGHANGVGVVDGGVRGVVAFDRVAGFASIRVVNIYDYDTDARVARLAERVLSWYEEENRVLLTAKAAKPEWAGITVTGWPGTAPDWPLFAIDANFSDGTEHRIALQLFPITDTTHKTYTYGVLASVELLPPDKVDKVELQLDQPTLSLLTGSGPTFCHAVPGSITVSQVTPQVASWQHVEEAQWTLALGKSVGMTPSGPTTPLESPTSVQGSVIAEGPGSAKVSATSTSDGVVHWTWDLDPSTGVQQATLFGAVLEISYDGKNEGTYPTCAWGIAPDVAHKNPMEEWDFTITIPGASPVKHAAMLLHPLDDAHAKVVLGAKPTP